MPKLNFRYSPDYALHPGKVLCAEIGARGISPSELAVRMQTPLSTVNAVLAERQDVTSSTATAIERALKIRAQTWLNLQDIHDQVLAEIRARRPQATDAAAD